MPEFRPLAKNHIRDLYRLEVRPDQTKFVAPNGVTLAQWPFEPGSMVFGIWEGETAVGLLAMIDFSHPEADLQEGEDPTALYVWRLLIGADHQRKGYGTAALDFAKAKRIEMGLSAIFISAVDEPGSAIPLYEKEGFVRTGRIVDGETELVWRPD